MSEIWSQTHKFCYGQLYLKLLNCLEDGIWKTFFYWKCVRFQKNRVNGIHYLIVCVVEKKVKKAARLPISLLDTALLQCEQFLRFTENEELEEVNEHEMLDIDWDAFLQQYYQLCQ
mgnify:FL=1